MQKDPPLNVSQLIEEQKIGRFAIMLLFWCFLVMLMDGYDQTAVSFAAPAMIREWHVARGGFGPVFGAGLFGTLIGSIVLGYAGDRMGRKLTIIIGTFIFGALTFSSIWADSLRQLMWLRFIAGIGMGGVIPNAVALAAEYAPKRLRATWVTTMFSGFSIGAGSGGFISAAFMHQYGWPVMFVIGGIGSMAVALLLIFVLPESARLLVLKKRQPRKVARLIARLRPELTIPAHAEFFASDEKKTSKFVIKLIFSEQLLFITPLLWIIFIGNSMSLYFLQNWLPILIEAVGVLPQRAALVTAMFSVGGMLGGLLLMRFVDRYGMFAVIALPLVGIPTVALLGSGMSETLLMVAVFITGFSVVGTQYGLYAIAGMVYPTEFRSGGIGIAISIGKIGSVAGPVIGGLLLSMHLPITRLFYVATVPFIVVSVFSIVLALIYRANFGQDHATARGTRNGLRQSSALGDS